MKDISLQQYEQLTAIRYVKPSERLPKHKDVNGAIWLCQCNCGKTCFIPLSNWGRQQSCGCRRFGPHPDKQLNKHVNWKGSEHIPKSIINRFHRHAIKRNILFTLTLDDIEQVYLSQDKKCSLTGAPIQFGVDNRGNASIDRIDSNLGYTKDNIQCVLKSINMMKGTLTQDEFIKLCVAVSSFLVCGHDAA